MWPLSSCAYFSFVAYATAVSLRVSATYNEQYLAQSVPYPSSSQVFYYACAVPRYEMVKTTNVASHVHEETLM
jgi:hypothetical protein